MGTLTLALFLLLPIAFLAGWWVSARRVRRPTPVPLPRAYVQGLGHLLGERNDEAVKTFLDALRRYPESSELLLALGRMFRRRGELLAQLGAFTPEGDPRLENPKHQHRQEGGGQRRRQPDPDGR